MQNLCIKTNSFIDNTKVCEFQNINHSEACGHSRSAICLTCKFRKKVTNLSIHCDNKYSPKFLKGIKNNDGCDFWEMSE